VAVAEGGGGRKKAKWQAAAVPFAAGKNGDTAYGRGVGACSTHEQRDEPM